jgi:hypothetical protein
VTAPATAPAFGDRRGHPGCPGCQMCIGECLEATEPADADTLVPYARETARALGWTDAQLDAVEDGIGRPVSVNDAVVICARAPEPGDPRCARGAAAWTVLREETVACAARANATWFGLPSDPRSAAFDLHAGGDA